MNLLKTALEAYQKYGAERLKQLQDPQFLAGALERELELTETPFFTDAQGIVMAEHQGLYFYFMDERLHILLEHEGQAPIWSPFEGLVGLGRLIMMRDLGQVKFVEPTQLNPIQR